MKKGNKYDNLVFLDRLSEKLKSSLVSVFSKTEYGSDYVGVTVPRFVGISSSPFFDWLESGKDSLYSNSELRTAFERFSDGKTTLNDIIVRSSSIVVEDSEERTGAGIYESVKLRCRSSFEEFIGAVNEVYESFSNEKAESYREGTEDFLGLVIQELGPEKNDETKTQWKYGAGYSNSSIKGRKDVIKLSLNGCSVFVDKSKLSDAKGFRTIGQLSFLDSFERRPAKRLGDVGYADIYASKKFDRYCHKPFLLERLAVLVDSLSEELGYAIQLEFGFDLNFSGELEIFLYQVRKLNVPEKIEVPKENVPDGYVKIATGECSEPVSAKFEVVGMSDIALSKGKCLHVETSFNTSDKDPEKFVKELGLLVSFGDCAEDGHLETRCMEYGVPYVDHMEFEPYAEALSRIRSLEHFGSVYVWSDGITANLYGKIKDL